MQFLAPTFAAVTAKHAIPAGGQNPPSLYNPHDAIYAAADYLCDNGARDATNINNALWTYNHSSIYINQVLTQAARYYQAAVAAQPRATPTPTPTTPEPNPASANASSSGGGGGSSSTVSAVLGFAHAQIGSKYVWGGNGAASGGFDCSGLTTAAYRAAGITLPRTAQTQYNTGPRLPPGSTAQPGDLVFYGTSPNHVTHVGIATSPTTMIDAPDIGTTVRQDPIQHNLIGITRPNQTQ
jgi:cell wall-associated NlpC family hydrolase